VNIGIGTGTVVELGETVAAAHQLRVLLDRNNGGASVMHLWWVAAAKPYQVTGTSGIASKNVIYLQQYAYAQWN
jgi:hypothetical protein